jgi:hypothetical protein
MFGGNESRDNITHGLRAEIYIIIYVFCLVISGPIYLTQTIYILSCILIFFLSMIHLFLLNYRMTHLFSMLQNYFGIFLFCVGTLKTRYLHIQTLSKDKE